MQGRWQYIRFKMCLVDGNKDLILMRRLSTNRQLPVLSPGNVQVHHSDIILQDPTVSMTHVCVRAYSVPGYKF